MNVNKEFPINEEEYRQKKIIIKCSACHKNCGFHYDGNECIQCQKSYVSSCTFSNSLITLDLHSKFFSYTREEANNLKLSLIPTSKI